MAVAEEIEGTPAAKPSRLPLLLGLILALAGGGGGFFAVYSGMLFGSDATAEAPHSELQLKAMPDVAFVPLEPLIVSLATGTTSRHLRFRAELEVPSAHRADVEALRPRIIDVLNGYLRAVEPGDIEGPAALVRLRAQMLRRVQMVVGQGRVRDLLVMEFVLS